MRVLEALIFDFLNHASGRLDPSYEGIAKATRLARSTVAVAIAKLKQLGIIHWQRRCVPAYVNGVFTLRQRTNAYAVLPPSQWVGHVDPDTLHELLPDEWGAMPLMPTLLAQAAQAATEDGASPARQAIILDADPGDLVAASLAGLARALAIVHQQKASNP